MLLNHKNNSKTDFPEVLHINSKGVIESELKKFFKDKKLRFRGLSIDKFFTVEEELSDIGTAIINTVSLDEIQHQKLGKIIEKLESAGVGVILVNSQMKSKTKSFHVSDCKSFTLSHGEKSQYDVLWDDIKRNLAERKPSRQFTSRPSPKPDLAGDGFEIAEQLTKASEVVKSLSEQLKLAGIVQRDFLPRELPDTERIKWSASFNPAEWVSGDIYDVERLDENHIGFLLADAVGHSMPAALLTIFIKQAMVLKEIKNNNYRIYEPCEVLKNLNQKLASQELSGFKFVTCFYGIINIKTLELKCSRAGHPYPILMRPNEYPEQLEVRGSLLGVFENAEFKQECVQLERGDKVLVYSDGAETLVGQTGDSEKFVFTPEFLNTKEGKIEDVTDLFTGFANNLKSSPKEIDDVTALGFEIN